MRYMAPVPCGLKLSSLWNKISAEVFIFIIMTTIFSGGGQLLNNDQCVFYLTMFPQSILNLPQFDPVAPDLDLSIDSA